jgi:hypothetical protein
LLKLDLDELVGRSGKVFRGTVLSFRTGTVEVGGGSLPTVTYVFRVDEAFKGAFETKEDATGAEITMVGTVKRSTVKVGDAVWFSVLPEIPQLEVGSDYLMFVTPESEIGLSISVGLGQGAFSLFEADRQTYAVNTYNNANLDLNGPVLYSDLAAKIRAMLGN